jgi:curli biogenesis system outer membrane secretion channel CsgG
MLGGWPVSRHRPVTARRGVSRQGQKQDQKAREGDGMSMQSKTVGRAGVVALLMAITVSCATSSDDIKEKDPGNVGRYDAPPGGIDRPRTGVPPFEPAQGSSKELTEVAADQLSTLATNCERFDVIERAQLQQLLKEQGLEGIVKPDELAQSGKVRGVDYLLIGKVTNLRVKAEKQNRGFGFGNVGLPGGGSLGGFDFSRKDSIITAECGVDLRLVDATSGKVDAAQHSDFTRTDTVGAFGVEILGANAESGADLKLDEDNKGLILRYALDDALRKMLPKVDKALMARTKQMKAAAATAAAASAPAEGPAASAAPAGATAAPAAPAAPAPDATLKKFCPSCGGALAAGAKFCGGCGAKLE